jgi:lysophospholipase L1-like esterase
MRKLLLLALFGAACFLAGFVVDHLQVQPYQQLMAAKEAFPLATRLSLYLKHMRGDDAPADIIMLGDSITEGADWQALLGRDDVLNFGEAGDTTNGVIHRLYRVTAHKPRLVFLMIGINDLAGDTPPDIVERNIQLIVTRLIKSGAKPVLQGILLLRNERAGELNPVIAALDERLQTWSAQNNVLFLDLNPVLAAGGALDAAVTRDGEHLNAQGYTRWADKVRPVIAGNLPRR